MEIWAQNSATRRPAFLLQQRARAVSHGPGHPGCRPSLSPAWRISPGCPWIDNFRGFGIRFDNTFCCSCMDYSFRLLFAFVSMCRSRQAQFFLQVYRNSLYQRNCMTPFPSSPTAFRLLSHTLTPIFTPRWQPRALREYTKLRYTYACKSQDLKAADSGFHFGPCAVRFIHWVACMVLFFANHGTPSF